MLFFLQVFESRSGPDLSYKIWSSFIYVHVKTDFFPSKNCITVLSYTGKTKVRRYEIVRYCLGTKQQPTI